MDTKQLIDPELAAVVDAFPDLTMTPESLALIREFAFEEDLSDAVVRSEEVLPGSPEVSVRIHRPVNAVGTLPCVLSMHGGGFVIGSASMDDTLFDRWCPTLGVVGISVEYRLAPETPYPGPLDDCYRALLWTVENAERLGIESTRIGVHGISAGGGLAACLALLARDRGEVALAFQLLDCPMLDDRRITPSSRLDGLPIWSRESNEFGWRSYLGTRFGSDDVPYTAAAARAVDLANLPPTFVSVGTVDGFRDEDIDYALRLNQAGVPTELHVYPGAPHGYAIVPDSAVAKQGGRDKADWLAKHVRPR
jgi:acetyl esterase/lipase